MIVVGILGRMGDVLEVAPRGRHGALRRLSAPRRSGLPGSAAPVLARLLATRRSHASKRHRGACGRSGPAGGPPARRRSSPRTRARAPLPAGRARYGAREATALLSHGGRRPVRGRRSSSSARRSCSARRARPPPRSPDPPAHDPDGAFAGVCCLATRLMPARIRPCVGRRRDVGVEPLRARYRNSHALANPSPGGCSARLGHRDRVSGSCSDPAPFTGAELRPASANPVAIWPRWRSGRLTRPRRAARVLRGLGSSRLSGSSNRPGSRGGDAPAAIVGFPGRRTRRRGLARPGRSRRCGRR